MAHLLRSVAPVTLALCLGTSALALAQDATGAGPSAEAGAGETAEYDAAIHAAITAFGNKDLPTAMAEFERAHTLSPSARTLRGMGMVAFEMRRFQRAHGLLERALSDPRGRLADRQRNHVVDLLQRSRAFLGVFEVSIQPAHATLLVDGEPAPASAEGELWLDLGRHEVEVRAEGYETARVELEVVGNEHRPLPIELEKAAASVAVVPVVEQPEAPDRTEERITEDAPAAETGATNWLPVSLVGAGAVALVGAGVTAFLASDAETELDELCGAERQCPDAVFPEAEDTQGRGRTLAVVTDVLLLAGVAMAATGAVLWALEPAEGQSGPTLSATGMCVPGRCGVTTKVVF